MVADYCVFETAWGWCAIGRTALGVCTLVLPLPTEQEAEQMIRDRSPGAASLPTGLKGLRWQVRQYFEGKPVAFEADLDFTAGSPFQRRCWQAVCTIPYGQVRTYQGIGLEIGRPEAMRAVGAAVGANPIPLIVPCHRVVRGDGHLGGFSAPGGPEVKRSMLALEGLPLHGCGEDTRVLA